MVFFSSVFIFVTVFCSCIYASAQESYTLEKIVVRAEDGLSEVISASDIKKGNFNSIAEPLNCISGADLRWRGAFGIQGDLTIRGSTYEEVGVLIDGVRVSDPQTGHHNLDIPLTSFDLERIEVVKEGASSLYGAGALAGSVNFVTAKPEKKSLKVNTLFGEHALFGSGFSLSLPIEDFSSRFSFDRKQSKGDPANTDFEQETASLYLNKDFSAFSADTLFGYQEKDFGASTFYSNLSSEQEERTETIFLKTGLSGKGEGLWRESNFSLRRHRDKFIFRRNQPTSINHHTTYSYGLDSQFSLPVEYGVFSSVVDFGRDKIDSSNLAKHSRLYQGASVGFVPDLDGAWTADCRGRADHYEDWGWEESYNLGLGYRINDELRFKGSLSQGFRVPTFTELYYSSSENIGNENLEPEKAEVFNLGLHFKEDSFALALEGFMRRGHNLIDWTRTSTNDPWQATNLGRVDFYGIEFNSKLKPEIDLGGLDLEQVTFSYNYNYADKKAGGFFSKYALDILRNQFILGIDSVVCGLQFNWRLSYNQRYYGETYFIGDVSIAKKISCGDFILEPFVGIDNFSDTEYSENSGVVQAGRWVKGGLKFTW